MKLAPIVLFVYNRLWHTQQTIEALQKNDLAKQSELIIYADGAKDAQSIEQVNEVRQYISTIQNFKKISIVEREKNFGLANSIIDGVTTVVNQYGKVIVLEDDLITSPYFLTFMNDALKLYENEEKVSSIHGYSVPMNISESTYFIKGADCWGWATWQRSWKLFEIDGQKLLDQVTSKKLQYDANFNNSFNYTKMLKHQIKKKNDSWAIRWYFSTYLNNTLSLYTTKSYVRNIGLDNSGVHCRAVNYFDVELNETYETIQKITLNESKVARKQKAQIFKKIFYKKIIDEIKFIALLQPNSYLFSLIKKKYIKYFS